MEDEDFATNNDGLIRGENCRTPSRPRSSVVVPIAMESHRESRTRSRSISSKRNEAVSRKRRRQSSRIRITPTTSFRDLSKSGNRKSRTREREDISHHRRRKSSRKRQHERRRGRSRERSRSCDKKHRNKRSRSASRHRNHRRSCSGSRLSRDRSNARTEPVAVEGDHASILNLNTQTFFKELVKTLISNRPEGNKFPMLGNIIPEFNPMVKGQTIHMWLSKVEECARLYNWGDDQIIHYALPKLTGVAKSWYQALPSMSFSWREWKVKLVETFPSSNDYAELLTEMLTRRVKYNEPLELYYYDKINLLNRCEIYGKRAVDCLLYGIDDRSLRLGAKATKCQEPEQVLEYFQSIKQQTRETDRFSKLSQDKRNSGNVMGNSTPNIKEYSNDLKTSRSQTNAPIKCYNCNEIGHYSFKCTKKILKCNICNKLGHTAVNCPRLAGDAKNSNSAVEKSVLQVDTGDSNDKYTVDL